MNFKEFKADFLSSFPNCTPSELQQAWRESGYAPVPPPIVPMLEEIITKAFKRVLDDSDNNSAASKRTNPNRPGQAAFVQRISNRDAQCPILNTPKDGCVGAHIIGFDYWSKNQDIWDEQYKQCCYEWTHHVDDVRNGILMDPRLHRYFDNYFFTIYKKDDIFTIKVGETLYPNDPEFANLGGKHLEFGSEKYLWPHDEFLKFHNRKFTFKQMKAAAEPQQSNRQDSGNAIHNLESSDYFREKWINEQMGNTDFENFQEENNSLD